MASSGLRDILDELVDVLRDALDGSDPPLQIERGYVLNPSPPSVDVFVSDPAREFTAAGFGDVAGAYLITIRARVLTADTDAGQDLLISFMDHTDDLCIPAAVLTDPTLNGNAAMVGMVGQSGHRAYETPDGASAYLGCQFDFLVTPAVT